MNKASKANAPLRAVTNISDAVIKLLSARGHTTAFIAALLGLMTVPAQADITVSIKNHSTARQPHSFTWIVNNFNSTSVGIGTSTPVDKISPIIAGSLVDAESFNGTESLELEIYATQLWDTITPDEDNFSAQIADIRGKAPNDGEANLFMHNSAISTGTANLQNKGQALFLEINTNSAGGIVTLKNLGLANAQGEDSMNFRVWDSDNSEFLTNQIGEATELDYGDYTLTTGDIVVFAVHEDDIGNCKLKSITLDITPVPEPSSFTFVLMSMVLAFCLRRRCNFH